MTLRTRSIVSFRRIGASHVLRSLISAVTLIVLARILTPAEFGQVGMAVAIVGLLLLAVQMGFRQAIIQHPAPDDRLASSAWWLNLVGGLLCMLVLMVAADWIGALCREPVVSDIVIGLAPLLPLTAIRAIPMAMLERRLEFQRLAGIEVIVTLAGALAGIGAAVLGMGAQSLVVQMLVASSMLTLLLFLISGWHPDMRFSGDSVRQIVRFGRQTTVAESVDYLGRHVDDFLVGRFLGTQSLGFYGIAYQIMLFPMLVISRLIARVLLPAAARVQQDNARLSEAFIEVAVGVAIVTFPLMLGVASLAQPLVLLVLGEDWAPMIPLVLILAPVGALQSVASLSESLFLAKGRADLRLRWSLIQTCGVLVAIVAGLPWGVVGVASAYAIASVCLAGPLLLVVCRLVELRPRRLLNALVGPLVATLGMMLCVRLLYLIQPGDQAAPVVAAGLGILAAVVSYSGLIVWFEGTRLRRMFRELRGGDSRE